MFYNIFYGLLLFAGGIVVLKYRKNIHDWTGGWWWAEHYLGRWGTVVVLCLIGCGMMGFGVATMFGKVDLSGKQPTNLSSPIQNNNSSTSVSR